MTEISIIIVTYNGLNETTVPCLESIFKHAGKEKFEVIVVDNNSKDGTATYLTELSKQESRIRTVLNTTNRGFAGGNNDGISIASGEIIVLLNNDTQVTAGWLGRIREALLSDHTIGLLGPVSNAVGNEQKIYTTGTTPAEIIAEGLEWAKHSTSDRFETERLGFFCVAFRRDILNSVGLLDEAYDLGFYEDDDYCQRVLKAGYKLVCLEDVFIYHRGSASFDKAPKRTKELLKKNRKLLEKKIGKTYSPRHPRDRQLDLVESYTQKLKGTSEYKSLKFKIDSRIKLLDVLMPKGFLKRWLFVRRLNTLMNYLKHRELYL